MTNEKAREILNILKEYERAYQYSKEEVVGALDMANKALEQTSWIPVSERLPEIQQDILMSLRNPDIVVGFMSELESYFYCRSVDGCYIESQNVLAWMPLPQPYKAESEDD